jgi:hypothetical protein
MENELELLKSLDMLTAPSDAATKRIYIGNSNIGHTRTNIGNPNLCAVGIIEKESGGTLIGKLAISFLVVNEAKSIFLTIK